MGGGGAPQLEFSQLPVQRFPAAETFELGWAGLSWAKEGPLNLFPMTHPKQDNGSEALEANIGTAHQGLTELETQNFPKLKGLKGQK